MTADRRAAGRRSRPARPTWALIAGGGTGGHVIPAIAIAQALVARGHPPETIGFVGSTRGMERRMVPAAGFAVTLLPGRGVARHVTPANLGAIGGLVVATGRAVLLVRRRRPAVVVVVGGYASVACVLAAAVWRVPIVVAEQNAVPGLANRMAARFARASAVSFPRTALPRAVLTGNPVRAEMTAIDRSPAGRARARGELGLDPDSFVVFITGGSLGARRINEAVVALARSWSQRSGWTLRHVVGERDWETIRALAPEAVPGGLTYQQIQFEDRMDLAYAAADIAVQRAGASTVAELAVAGLPAVLIPLPGAPGDHQSANARRLEAAGAAVILPDAQLSAGRLGAQLDGLAADPACLASMAAAAKSLARPGAADAVAALAEDHARG